MLKERLPHGYLTVEVAAKSKSSDLATGWTSSEQKVLPAR